MRIRIGVLSALLLWPSWGWAQDSDTKQILEMLQTMNKRFDTLEERIDKLEKPAPPPPATSAPSASAAVAAPGSKPPSGVAVPGWKIDVLPYVDGKISEAPIARLSSPAGQMNFDLHLQNGNLSNWFMYRGEAYLSVTEQGTHTFILDISSTGALVCGGNVSLDDSLIVKDFETKSATVRSGSVDLRDGYYQIRFEAGCRKRKDGFGKYDFPDLKASSVHVKILGPNDNEARDFGEDELFYIRK